ncbi:MAG: 16S rRNA (adenine(1518)-N(6)/adenine(1519)-N(6))-dimethyltransferase RsmA [Clostridia bacterium]|nr:16S rRNA (adenine(1518)-N(6)/adenine(1519)-N(6))-dimethyltransferase RsmA [Clostridia bacterium]
MPVYPSAGLRARVALEKYGFRTTHSLGQNFLLDDNLLNHLLDDCALSETDHVLEIGPGAGVMTALMAERVSQVVAVEIDNGLKPLLEDVLAPNENATVVFADFMKLDVDALIAEKFGDHPYRVVANLPYYITSDILLKLIACERVPECINIMVQKEAAQRLMSDPGEKQWCALSALVRAYGMTKIIEEVPPEAFNPPPHVDSAFLEISRYDVPIVAPKDPAHFRKTVEAAFRMRRKTLANNLKTAFGLSADRCAELTNALGVDERVRGETLTPEQLCSLSDMLQN